MKMENQTELLRQMEKEFKITRKIFLNIKTGWFDNSKNRSNLVSAKDIAIEQIQGRYRLNLNDNELKIQEFFFDLEWSAFTEDGEKIKVITKQIVEDYYPRLKKAAKKLLFILFKYIPKDFIYIRVSGSGLHLIFFLKGLKNMDEWRLITQYLIYKSKLPNTKRAEKLAFGLDSETIISSDRKIAEFGSWNKLKKDLKAEVDYLNYAAYLTVDEFFKAKHYPFCSDLKSVKYPQYQYFVLPKKLLEDAKTVKIDETVNPVKCRKSEISEHAQKSYRFLTDSSPVKDLTPVKDGNFVSSKIVIPNLDSAMHLKKCPAYWSILRKNETEWYERHFLVKFLKYILKLTKEEIIELIDKYNCWNDYNKQTTAYYIRKHFREGTCETKVKKPPKKKTLIKYGLCEGKCKGCVYYGGWL